MVLSVVVVIVIGRGAVVGNLSCLFSDDAINSKAAEDTDVIEDKMLDRSLILAGATMLL